MSAISLDDKYDWHAPRALTSGRQALVALMLAQRELDRKRGYKTAGFVSGYRGSPLGGVDFEFRKARQTLEAADIFFQPGLNEDLALTSLAGTQQLGFLPDPKVEGVFGLWYGKGPGVDRSGDAIKHANLAGVAQRGGIVLAFGDDHAGKSSTTAHQSDLTLASWEVPVLYPASVAEIIEYGLAAFAMSRFAGSLVALKLVNETADGTAILAHDHLPDFIEPSLPEVAADVHHRSEVMAVLQQDARVVRQKLPRAGAFARANGLDGIRFGADRPRLLIATPGKAYPDVLAALEKLGIDAAAARHAGIGVYKIALLYPLEATALLAASDRADEIFFVEEKRAHAETQAKSIFYGQSRQPRICGKFSPESAALLPADAPLDIATVARALALRIERTIGDVGLKVPGFPAAVHALRAPKASHPVIAARRPTFCAGCPHNTSTKVPAGSFAFTGIGCHGMALLDPQRRPLPMGHMGAEGANWIGLARFTGTKHVFQNLGDGTYVHSGSLAIRAARAAGVNITYKILCNDAVAMTGGQPVEGEITVTDIARQVLAEGVRTVIVVSQDPSRFTGADVLPREIELRHRDELDQVQQRLREVKGVSVLIYDQVCAAEKRRRAKIQPPARPRKSVFINPLVCEGCGDCSVQSSCVAIQPLETEYGRKRRIDQSACNEDLSCLAGFCPSFVVLEGATSKRQHPLAARRDVPLPPALPGLASEGWDMLITGVGGTGVTTVAQIIAMAARIDGHAASVYDMTGLSQKGGAVFSHVRVYLPNGEAPPARLGAGEADAILACDLVASVSPEAMNVIAPKRSRVFVNTDVSSTAAFISDRDHEIDTHKLLAALAGTAENPPTRVAASTLAAAELGDTIYTNMLMLGLAWQAGAVPLSLASIERAIELNGRNKMDNLGAFSLGRAAHSQTAAMPPQPVSIDEFVEQRAADLRLYWNDRYAVRYRTLMQSVKAAAARVEGGDRFGWAVARGAYKLMAYKDEYEVARLYTDGRFQRALDAQFETTGRLELRLAPPILTRTDARTGRPAKLAFAGAWMLPLLKVLARFKGLRESPLDLFAYNQERRLERRLRDAYLERMQQEAQLLTSTRLEHARQLAEMAMSVRGFGPVKAAGAEKTLSALLDARTAP
nr:indolepyruvate ferredoxin oxidoreductase family protein [uncultured Steroidobacter sp.]